MNLDWETLFRYSSFQLSVGSNSRLLWFTTLCDWCTKFAPKKILNQWETKPKSSHAFFRAWRRLHASASSSDWFIGLFTSVVIGQSKYLGCGFYETHLKSAVKSIAGKENHKKLELYRQRRGFSTCVRTTDPTQNVRTVLQSKMH